MKLKLIPALACALLAAGCGEQPPAEKPPEARATPRLVPNAPDPVEDPHAGHNHGPGEGHVHEHDHGPGDGHDHPPASPSPAASAKAQQIPMHGYSPDGKPSK